MLEVGLPPELELSVVFVTIDDSAVDLVKKRVLALANEW